MVTRAALLTLAVLLLAVCSDDGSTKKSSGPPDCAWPLRLCGDDCVDVRVDASHCGACGEVCGAASNCLAGACLAATCDGTLLLPGPPTPQGFSSIHGTTTGDLDADGRTDVLASGATLDGVSGLYLLAGRGEGTLAPPDLLAPITNLDAAVAIADLDGVGLPDVAVAVRADGARAPGVALIFEAAGAFSTMHHPWLDVSGLAVADFDLDGDNDVAVAGWIPAQGPVGIRFLHNEGGGVFTWAPTELGPLGTIGDLAAGDVDGDGDVDVVASCAWGELGVWRNEGELAFTHAACVTAGGYFADVELADLDGDGDLDFVVPGPRVLWNDGSGRPSDGVSWELGGSGSAVAIADLEGDGDPDVISALQLFFPDTGQFHSGGLRVLRNEGGTLSPEATIPILPWAFDLSAADLDGDGDADVVLSDGMAGQLDVLLSTGGAFHRRVRWLVPTGAQNRVALADLGGDGALDAIAAGGTTLTTVRAPSPDGRPAVTATWSSEPLQGLAVGDLDRDGRLDHGTAVPSLRHVALWLSGSPEPTFAEFESADGVAFGDLDGDGSLDLVVARATGSPALQVRWGEGFRPDQVVPVPERPLDLVSGDLDGDGRDELVVVGDVSLMVFELDEQGTLVQSGTQQVGTFAPRIADLGTDGAVEVVAPVLLEREVQLFRLALPGLVPHDTVQTAGFTAAVAVADMDLDGRDDLLVLDVDGLVQVFRSTAQGTLEDAGTWPTGASSRVGFLSLAAGDLDGDRRPDLAILAPTELIVIGSGCRP